MIAEWTDEQREAFGRDGFLIVEEGFLDDDAVEALREVHPEHVDPVYSRYRRVGDMTSTSRSSRSCGRATAVGPRGSTS